jgi:hypothetical protein
MYWKHQRWQCLHAAQFTGGNKKQGTRWSHSLQLYNSSAWSRVPVLQMNSADRTQCSGTRSLYCTRIYASCCNTQYSVQWRSTGYLLVIGAWFHVNSTTCSGHTETSSGIMCYTVLSRVWITSLIIAGSGSLESIYWTHGGLNYNLI